MPRLNKKIDTTKLREEHETPKRTKRSRIASQLTRKGLKRFEINGKIIWAINLPNAIRKAGK